VLISSPFIGFSSALAGRRAALRLSLAASCKTNRVEPWAYMCDIFGQRPRAVDLEEFLPDRWLSRHSGHGRQIADLRAQERAAKGGL